MWVLQNRVRMRVPVVHKLTFRFLKRCVFSTRQWESRHRCYNSSCWWRRPYHRNTVALCLLWMGIWIFCEFSLNLPSDWLTVLVLHHSTPVLSQHLGQFRLGQWRCMIHQTRSRVRRTSSCWICRGSQRVFGRDRNHTKQRVYNQLLTKLKLPSIGLDRMEI